MELIYCMDKDDLNYEKKHLGMSGYLGLNFSLTDTSDIDWHRNGKQTVLKLNKETKTVELLHEDELRALVNKQDETSETEVLMERNYAKGEIFLTETGSIGGGNYGKVREQFIKAELEKLDDKRRNYEQELKELKQLYYLKVDYNAISCLNLVLSNEMWIVADNRQKDGFQTKFTKEEIMDLNEGLWSIAVPVEEDDRRC